MCRLSHKASDFMGFLAEIRQPMLGNGQFSPKREFHDSWSELSAGRPETCVYRLLVNLRHVCKVAFAAP